MDKYLNSGQVLLEEVVDIYYMFFYYKLYIKYRYVEWRNCEIICRERIGEIEEIVEEIYLEKIMFFLRCGLEGLVDMFMNVFEFE